jgi:NAD(P)-dependent dehydrogenase (short-subunit alcohol dehydrogenase family)
LERGEFNPRRSLLPDKVDVLINNAGVFFVDSFEEFSSMNWLLSFYTNIFLPFFLTQCLVREKRLGKNSIVLNINSKDIFNHPIHQIAYNCSKAALHEFTISLGKELRRKEIVVDEIVLEAVKTDMMKVVNPFNSNLNKILTPRAAARLICQRIETI